MCVTSRRCRFSDLWPPYPFNFICCDAGPWVLGLELANFLKFFRAERTDTIRGILMHVPCRLEVNLRTASKRRKQVSQPRDLNRTVTEQSKSMPDKRKHRMELIGQRRYPCLCSPRLHLRVNSAQLADCVPQCHLSFGWFQIRQSRRGVRRITLHCCDLDACEMEN